jgi:hypothetical protein
MVEVEVEVEIKVAQETNQACMYLKLMKLTSFFVRLDRLV